MENRIQHLLLAVLKQTVKHAILPLALAVPAANSVDAIDSEVFEFGVSAGVLNIEDFSSEYTLGANVSFKATEDFFLQFNYLQADAGLSSYEKSQGQSFGGGDRTFQHFDLLLGYNLFQAEFFTGDSTANLSAFYLVGGVGNTEFGGEASFTYTVGAGYQVAIARKIIVRADYRDYMYTSILSDSDKTTHNGGITLGVGYLF
ncbi:outer membrane beta-barrel domain-containing protein [Teredinibacter haidensis]|uniref:outer membrane beta-barrel domain-containing protein n=1 Tax=Teredinibacter haidensis TaxID=2731755 RepID=UPI000948BF61|nr:outer membrane beta-barrel domain-containing protein [Teredinibacter haidensis]